MFMQLLSDDQEAFGLLVEPYRRELQTHCYRMMGTVSDAEEMVQEAFLRAWRRRETFEGRATLRAWLYKIATNVCLDALSQQPRRGLPITRRAAASLEMPIPPDVNDPVWLEPVPDDLLAPEAEQPEARYSARTAISIAFMAALHLLPPRQRAILILRDVLEFHTREVSALLDLTELAVKSALHRARSTLAKHPHLHRLDHLAADDLSVQQHAQLERYVQAWETADIDALVTLLKDEATFSMPPIPSWYQGRETIAGLVAKTVFRGDAYGRWRLRPTHANRQRAYGLYRRDEVGTYHAYGIQVVTWEARQMQISDILTFRVPHLFAAFGLPAVLLPT
jgi:RNA polymerase sigma-70 factor, ECF subfamily